MTDAAFEFELKSGLPPAQAWRRIVDVSRHGDVVPFTRGSGPAPQDAHVGSRFVARTAFGPVGFDDVMVVRAITPGQGITFEKVGRLLGGRVDVIVEPVEPVAVCRAESRVLWRQTIVLPWVPRPLRPISDRIVRGLAPAIGAGYERVVTKLLAASG